MGSLRVTRLLVSGKATAANLVPLLWQEKAGSTGTAHDLGRSLGAGTDQG